MLEPMVGVKAVNTMDIKTLKNITIQVGVNIAITAGRISLPTTLPLVTNMPKNPSF